MMIFESEYFIKSKEGEFYKGDTVHVTTSDGGGRSGTISTITSKGLYLDVGNKRNAHFNFKDIVDIR